MFDITVTAKKDGILFGSLKFLGIIGYCTFELIELDDENFWVEFDYQKIDDESFITLIEINKPCIIEYLGTLMKFTDGEEGTL